VATLAYLAQPVTIPASSGIGFFAQYLDPRDYSTPVIAGSLESMVASQDYYCIDNAGNNMTSALSLTQGVFAGSAVTSIFNTNSQAILLTRFQLRGYPILDGAQLSFVTDDRSSQASYGLAEVSFDDNLITSPEFLRNLGAYIIGEKSTPHDRLQVVTINEFPAQLSYDLGQALSVVNSFSGVNSAWSIRSMRHEINLSRGIEHQVSYELERLQFRSYMVLDDATKGKLDSTNTLAT
jgi:hypothetical protein